MRKVKRWRYYCDHCGKGGCSGGHIKKHEQGCARNPARICGFCDVAGYTQKPMPELIEALGDGREDGVKRLDELADGCPMCMLAAIIQSGIQRGPSGDSDGYDEGFSVDFDFKKAKDNFWEAENEKRFLRGMGM